MTFESLFGDHLINNQGAKFDSADLNGKFVLIYFSAEWCPPCHHFTPFLVEFYKDLKATRNDFELVFVSSDRSAEPFQKYFGTMPWLAVPFERRDIKETLSSKFKVQGIPTLVVLDGEGNLINSKGREKVSQDPKGAQFPWHPVPLNTLIGTNFVTKGNNPIQKDPKTKVLGLYFSAHWCPPCRSFTPSLISTYEELKQQGKELEMIFVSFDRSEEGFKEYLDEMPWLAVPYSDESRRENLGERFEVEGIPSLVFLDENLNVITKNGVASIRSGFPYPFIPPAFAELNEATVGGLNEEPSLVLFAPQAEKEALLASLTPLAEEFRNAKKNITFLLATDPELISMLRGFAALPEKPRVMVLLDIPAQAKYLAEHEDFSPEAVRTFAEAYLSGSLVRQKIRQ